MVPRQCRCLCLLFLDHRRSDIDENTGAGSEHWDPLVRGFAIGVTVVLIGFLVVAGIVYFGSSYEFAGTGP